MNLVKALFGIGLILMSLVGFAYADENIVSNDTIVNDTILENATINDSIIENTTVNETVINETILENSTVNETFDNGTSTAILVFETSDTEKYLDYLSENLENYKLWIILGLIAFAGYVIIKMMIW